MERAELPSFRALSQKAEVSEKQLRKLRRGEVRQVRLEVLERVARALHVSLDELLATCGFCEGRSETASPPPASIETLRQECLRLQERLQRQQADLQERFQRESLQILESWLRAWPVAAAKARSDRAFPAVKLLPLVGCVEELLRRWDVVAVGSVGDRLPYDPRQHQLKQGNAEPGRLVEIRNPGYRQGETLLYRAIVVSVSEAIAPLDPSDVGNH